MPRHTAATTHEVAPTTPQPRSREMAWIVLHGVGLTIVALAITLLGAALGLGWWLNQQVMAFTTAAGTSLPQLKQELKTGWNTAATQTHGHVQFLVLGLDTLAQRGDAPPLTDTMLIASLNLENGQVRLLSLPRDLWSASYQTKINSLYTYGRERDPSNPSAFPTQVLSEMTGLQFHHTITLTLNQVSQLIDLLGGIDVHVATGFVDEQFPRTDVDVTVERDPLKLYERIEFQAGAQTMNGETALKYIRSRHSEGTEGDDNARSRRQQQVITALMQKMTQPNTLFNPTRLGQLYAFYQANYQTQLPLTQLIAIVKELGSAASSIELQSSQLGIYPDDPAGLITHPPLTPAFQNQWVYVIRNPEQFPSSISAQLGIPQ